MAGLRLVGFPTHSSAVEGLVRKLFGYSAVLRGGEWYVPENDPALRAGPKGILKMHGRLVLEPANFSEIASKLAKAVPPDFDEFHSHSLQAIPNQVHIAGNLGIISELTHVLTEITIASNDQLPAIIQNKLLPLLFEKLGYRYVVPVSVFSSIQQGYFSFAKQGCLVERFGVEKAKQLTFEQQAFAGIEMSGALEVLNFVDAMTRSVPAAFTLPVRRYGCAWHFYGDGVPRYSIEHVSGLFQTPLSSSSPRYTDLGMPSLSGLHNMKEQNIWRLLKLVVDGVNRLFSCLNDHKNFADSTGRIDYLAQLRGYAGVYLAFADLMQVNCWPDTHCRIAFSYSLLDKLANLKKHLGSHQDSEGDIAKQFASLGQGKELKRLIQTDIAPLYPDLAKPLLRMVGTCYWNLHRHLGKGVSPNGFDEVKRLSLFRGFRNLHHGSYLQNDKFEKLFLTSKGSVPPALATLPYILILGLLTNPSSFFSFKPTI
jgi:hypothetical protein